MAIIPKRASRDVAVTTQSTQPLVDLSDPGAAAEGRALQSLGGSIQQGAGAVANIAEAEKQRTQTDELHAATISDADSYNGFVNEQSKNPDYRTDVENYDKWRKLNEDATLNAFTDDQAKGDFKRQLDKQNIVRSAAVKEFSRNRHKQDIIGNMDETLDGFARNDMQEIGNDYITGLREGGWISGAQENQYQAALEKSVKNQEMIVAEQIVNDTVIGIAVAADAVEEGTGWEATQKWLNDPKTAKMLSDELGMSLDEVGQVLSDVRTQASLANADKVKQEEVASSTEEESVYAKMGKSEFVGIDDYIQAQPNITEKRKLQLQDEAKARSKAINSNEPDRNDPEALDKVNTAISQVGNNTLPLETAKNILKANSHLLKAGTADTAWKSLNGEFDASIDSATSNVRANVRLRAIGKSETALDRLLEAVAGVDGDEKKSLEERITTARVKFNLELDQFNRWEESQKSWRQANPDASPDEIEREGMRSWFTDYNVKDTEKLKRLSPSFKEKTSKKILDPPKSRSEAFNKINNLMPDTSLIGVSRENPDLVSGAITSVTSGQITVEQAVEQIKTESIVIDSGETKAIIMVSPDGEAFEIAPEKRQVFLDNGFVER